MRTVRADAELTMAEKSDLLGREPDLFGAIIDDYEIVSRAVHLRKFQKH